MAGLGTGEQEQQQPFAMAADGGATDATYAHNGGGSNGAKPVGLSVGDKVWVWWGGEHQWFAGEVDEDLGGGRYRVVYTDGDVEELELSKEVWERREEEGEGAFSGKAGSQGQRKEGLDSDDAALNIDVVDGKEGHYGEVVDMTPPPSPTAAQLSAAAAGVSRLAASVPAGAFQGITKHTGHCGGGGRGRGRGRGRGGRAGRGGGGRVPRMLKGLGVSEVNLEALTVPAKRRCTQQGFVGSDASYGVLEGSGDEENVQAKKKARGGLQIGSAGVKVGHSGSPDGAAAAGAGAGAGRAINSEALKEVKEIGYALGGVKRSFTGLSKKYQKVSKNLLVYTARRRPCGRPNAY
jgi:hypothetical protein